MESDQRMDRWRRTITNLRRLPAWFAELLLYLVVKPWRHYLAVLALAVPLLLLWYPAGDAELRVRLAALFLQVLGVLSVAIGLHSTRKLFGRPSATTRLAGYLRGIPRFSQSRNVRV